jgi:hypothetical protein
LFRFWLNIYKGEGDINKIFQMEIKFLDFKGDLCLFGFIRRIIDITAVGLYFTADKKKE